jgi:hypothetical protein
MKLNFNPSLMKNCKKQYLKGNIFKEKYFPII